MGILSNLFRRAGRLIDRSPHNPLAAKQSPAEGRAAVRQGEVPVSSSWIQSIRWDRDKPESKVGLLSIRKRPSHGGRAMLYAGVPENLYDDMFAAGSKGEFYNNYIKGKFPYLGEV